MYEQKEKLANEDNEFKKLEKKIKTLKQGEGVEEEIDFGNEARLRELGIVSSVLFCQKSQRHLRCFSFPYPSGFIVVRDYLTGDEQLRLGTVCLTDFLGEVIRRAAP